MKNQKILNGARVAEVEEPLAVAKSVLFEFEMDEIAEPKALSPDQLVNIVLKHGSFVKASKAIGASEAFVRQNVKNRFKQPSEK